MLHFIEQFYEETFEHINDHYTQDLIQAKNKFFKIVKFIPDEKEDLYETKMILFNEWFLFNYRENFQSNESFFSKILKDENFKFFSPDQITCIQEQYYSLFQFLRKKKKGYLFYDWQKKEKFFINSDFPLLGFLEGDLFIARRVKIQDEYWFLKGQSVLPQICHKLIFKQLKKVKKGKVDMNFEEFLINLESLKSETQVYPHVNPQKIFIFK